MSRIQLANLPSAGSELFQGSESFLTELKSTEAHAIYGGSKKKSKSKKSGGTTVVVIYPYPPCPPPCPPPCH